MSLAVSLNNALSGLNINRQSLAVLSQNIANANTQGYSRKIITQDSLYLDGQGVGVSIKDVSRKVDDYLIRSVRAQSAQVGQGDVVSDYFDRIQILVGKPGSRDSFDSDISNFFNSVQSLAQTPEDTSQRVNMMKSSETLARNISNLSNGLNDLRFQADQDMKAMVTAVNHDISEIDKLNKTVNSEMALGKPVGELLDKRDALIKDLAQYMDIQTYERSTGDMNIATTSGLALLDESVYVLTYTPAGSVDAFTNDSVLSGVYINRTDEAGNFIGAPKELVSSGTSGTVVSSIVSGKMRGLTDLRDIHIPAMLAQIDTLAANLRDAMNAIHNTGTGFPGATSYTGTRPVVAEEYTQWSGSLRIAALNSDGLPATGSYLDETVSRALTLDLSTLNTGAGVGRPDVQGIVDAINDYYGVPQNKLELGNMNNIRLVSNNTIMPTQPAQFSFDFDIQNFSNSNADMFITDVQILDSTGANMTNMVTNYPTVTLAGTYDTVQGSKKITVNTVGSNGLANGDKVYLTVPSGAIDNIPAGNFGQFFTVTNVTSTGFDIEMDRELQNTGTFAVSGQMAVPKYASATPNETRRTTSDGMLVANLSSNPASTFYTINVNMAVDDGNGNISTSLVSYRVSNNQSNLLNDHFVAFSATNNARIVTPASSQPLIQAKLVDDKGVELPKSAGRYTSTKMGYLQLESATGAFIAIDSLDSVQLGRPNSDLVTVGTNRGFSHYFELNNFFVRNQNADNNTVAGSARDLAVETRLSNNVNLISLGKLSATPNNIDGTPSYTYQRTIGDNRVIQAIASLGSQTMEFAAAGGLGQTTVVLGTYAGQIIGAAANVANAANTTKTNAQTLLDGYNQRSDSISGVNLDEELANTIIYQNAYSASARIITVVSQLFDTLIESVGR